MSDSVLLEHEGDIAEVVINRPAKMNSLDQSVFDGLAEVGEQIRADASVRAVVLTGAGESFSAGIDLAFLQASADVETYRKIVLSPPQGEIANAFQKPAFVWREIEVPVIAALRGVVFGGGCQIALGADMRIAAPDTRMSIMEIKWGLVPDMGISVLLPPLMPLDVAKRLTFTGEIVDAEAAKSLGLITEITDDPLARARGLAQEIAKKNPEAIRADKKLLNESWARSSAKTLLNLEAELQAAVMGTPNQMEAAAASMEKRDPVFK